MHRWICLFAPLSVLALALPVVAAPPAIGVPRNFGPSLTQQCPISEGIAVDTTGRVYAASVGTGTICVVDKFGSQTLAATIHVAAGAGGPAQLLGELFEPDQGLYVADLGNGRLVRLDVGPRTVGDVTPTQQTLASGFGAPNGIAQDRHRNLFVSDSFKGKIYKVSPDAGGGLPPVWSDDPALQPDPSFPFGVNGLAFDRNQRFLYAANTSKRTIVRIPVLDDGSAGTPQVFADAAHITVAPGVSAANALFRPDGIQLDVHGNVWVCANFGNEIQVFSPQGVLTAVYKGSGNDALAFPASLVFRGRELFIANADFANGGAVSKISVLTASSPGLPLRP